MILLETDSSASCIRLQKCSLPHNQFRGVSAMKAVIKNESDNIDVNFSGQKQYIQLP